MRKFDCDIPGIGTVFIEHVLLTSNEPVLFTLLDENRKRWLTALVRKHATQRIWLLAPVSNSDMLNMLENRATIRNTFLKYNAACVCVSLPEKSRPELYRPIPAALYPKLNLTMDAADNPSVRTLIEQLKSEPKGLTKNKGDTAAKTVEVSLAYAVTDNGRKVAFWLIPSTETCLDKETIERLAGKLGTDMFDNDVRYGIDRTVLPESVVTEILNKRATGR